MSDNNGKPVLNAFWQEVVDSAEGGGGGIITFAKIETGFKVYASGAQEASWFPAPGGKKNPVHVAQLAAAKAFSKNAGISKTPGWAVGIICPVAKSFTRGAPATWKVDRYFITDTFTSACSDIVIPSLQEHNINSTPFQGWVRLGFQDDPYGTKEKDQNGEDKIKQIAYVTEVFASEAAAMAAVKAAAGEGDAAAPAEAASDFPPGYNAATWAKVVPMLQAELAKGKLPPAVAAEYGMDVKYVIPLVAM